jgi:hypothetical protein
MRPDAHRARDETGWIRSATRRSTIRSGERSPRWSLGRSGNFERRSQRVGVNYLLNLRRGSNAEATSLSFDEFRDGLAEGLADAALDAS